VKIEEFSRRLTELRLRAGKRQRDVALACSVTVQAVSKWERGLSCPDILILNDLAAVLGVPVQELLVGDMEEELKVAYGERTLE
jgi:transcriptional regulator with XRE-family HTH domain